MITTFLFGDGAPKSNIVRCHVPKSNIVRCHVKDVKPGEWVKIQSCNFRPNIVNLECISNDPKTKKILLQVKWADYKERGVNECQQFIFDYGGTELKDFHLLNHVMRCGIKKDNSIEDTDIFSLQKQMNELIEKEEYERADQLQKKIDKLMKK